MPRGVSRRLVGNEPLGRLGRGYDVELAVVVTLTRHLSLRSVDGEARWRDKGLTDVAGIKVGHHTLTERPTGCTVVLVDGDGRGRRRLAARRRAGHARDRSARPAEHGRARQRDRAHRRQRLRTRRGTGRGPLSREKKIGYPIAGTVVPIVPGRRPDGSRVRRQLDDPPRPTADTVRRRRPATGPVAEGNVGAGAGATGRQARRRSNAR